MKVSSLIKSVVFGVLASAACANAFAQQVTISIGSGGNNTMQAESEVWCVNSGKACRVIGNRDNHAGPRTCSMTCNVNDIVVLSCSPNDPGDRWVDDVTVPSEAVLVSDTASREVYSWIATSNASTHCSYTD
ncbi:hypothetical protein [Teredinibacter sp. KSP-S5-2]|uniref:hypothetical protein n=1 Tax=Teredinibacter sp. KSP-S5-2 TaxID=3034506 RepID=UPI0029345C47|nr:hypothetical protein [Teredinibacter sp. KSP-S5-2]WNO10021.1 hypothetical protein P5V12_02430 [Teredinibacter sp. KSP-S5-2]